MPYIKQEKRPKYDVLTRKVVDELLNAGKVKDAAEAGDLNYVISSIVWSLWDTNPRYENGNMIVGALECVKQEFIRRPPQQLRRQKD
jgi:hypothetical protein